MHSIQKKTLNDYRKKFPHETLRETAQKTGIQLTRVFRLFNGYEMKLSEYLKFQKAILGVTSIQQGCPEVQSLNFITQNFFNIDHEVSNSLKDIIQYQLEIKNLNQPVLLQ